MMGDDPRQYLETLCEQRRETFAALSRLVGRNPAYIQQYVRKGTPRQLRERERAILARYFGIPESMLGGMSGEEQSFGALVPIARAGPPAGAAGPADDSRAANPCFAFHADEVRRWTSADPSQLAIIRIEGDAMSPTLNAGDDVLVDLSDGADRLRDGLYALKIDDIMLVKRLAVHPVGRRVTVQSDNPVYCDLPDCAPQEIPCLGRVIWAGRRLV